MYTRSLFFEAAMAEKPGSGEQGHRALHGQHLLVHIGDAPADVAHFRTFSNVSRMGGQGSQLHGKGRCE